MYHPNFKFFLVFALLGCSSCLATSPNKPGESGQPTLNQPGESGQPTLQPGESGQLPLKWKHDLSGSAQGVAVSPSGEVYLSVGSFGSGPFAEGGGAMVFSPDGSKIKDLPMILPKPCEACIRPSFQPNAPLLTSDGKSGYLSDYKLNLFRIDLASRSAELFPVNFNGLSTGISGLDEDTAVSGSQAYLSGSKVTVLNLSTGTVERRVDFGDYVQQIVPSDSRLLVNLTNKVVLWSPSTDASTSFSPSKPVRALASQEGWTVAILETGLGEYQVVELDLGTTPPGEKALEDFELSGGNELRLVLRPARRQVIVGTAGISAVTESAITILPGSTLLVDARQGAIARADTSSVRGVALSPDGNTLFVADTGGLKAFTLP